MNKHKIILVVLCFLCISFTYNITPKDIPQGLPPKIKGNFRIIERNTYKTHWIIYDVKSWEKTSDGVKMYPPVYVYEYYNNKWIIDNSQEPLDNIYRQELVTIINAKKKIKQPPKEGSADNLPAVPLDSTQAYYKLLKASEPINIPHNSSIDVQTRYLFDFFTRLYKKAGFSFEKTLIGYAEKYKKDPQFHTLRKYNNTAARVVWGHALYFSDLDDYPFHKYFSKKAYKALVTIEDTNKRLEGKN